MQIPILLMLNGTPLHKAADRVDATGSKVVEALITRNASIDAVFSHLTTPLTLACKAGNKESAALILKKGLSSNSIPATTINQELIDMVKNFGFEENYADELTTLMPTVEISGNDADLYS